MMIANQSLHSSIQSAKTGIQTLNQISHVDDQFPDLGDALSQHSPMQYAPTLDSITQTIIAASTFTMPVAALEMVQKRGPNEPAGLLTDIHRAYFVVKNKLYLWNYNERQEHNVYEEEYDIVAVGLCKPRPDLFAKEITHVLIIATTRTVNIIALQYKCDANLTDSLVFYKTNIFTNVDIRMRSILGTPTGRVFMLGDDGNIWELFYQSEDGWFTKGCYKKLLTNSMGFFQFGAERYIGMELSQDGHVLYQLTDSSMIDVIDLGERGEDYRFICTNKNIRQDASMLQTTSMHFTPSNFKIQSIYATGPSESARYQLVAVTTLGCRLYLTNNVKENRPTGLALCFVRTPPVLDSQPSTPSTPSALIQKSLYSNGSFITVTEANQAHTLYTMSPDMATLAQLGGRFYLCDLVNQQAIPEPVLAMTEMSSTPFKLNELALAVTEPKRQFLLLTATGLTLLIKQRPIDMLYNLIVRAGPRFSSQTPEYQAFLQQYGPIQVSALCYGLIACTEPALPPTRDLFAQPNGLLALSTIASKVAFDLLTQLGHQSGLIPCGNGQTYSSRHDGLALYIHRLIRPIWSQPLFKSALVNKQKKYETAISRSQLNSIQQSLRKLHAHLQLNQLDPHSPEQLSTQHLDDLIKAMVNVITLAITVIDKDLGAQLKTFPIGSEDKIMALTYSSVLMTFEGSACAQDLAGDDIRYLFHA